MSVKLIGYHGPNNARHTKIYTAAAYAGVTIQNVDSSVVDENPEAYALNCHPASKVPVLQTENGYIFESTAILRYFGRVGKNAGLYGHTDFEAASIDSWVEYVTNELDINGLTFVIAALGYRTYSEEEKSASLKAYVAALEGVEKWLEIRTFLVGERVTIADLALFGHIEAILRMTPQATEVYKFKNVVRHYMTMLHQPKVQEGLRAMNHEGSIPAKPKEEKAPAPKKEEAPKKEAKPAAAAADEEDDAPTFEDKKKPNPLDALPPSNFVLDAFKREYSNNDTRKVAAPFLFDNFDPAGYTAFWCNYKYNDENKMQFMTANLIRGWFQRMDHVRKYGFGIAIIAGEDKKHEVTCFWIFRGKGLPEIVREVDDTELFTWTEIPDIQAEKAKITDYLAWDGETFAKNPVLEGRAFK
jgi:elongation factor 1-gamma